MRVALLKADAADAETIGYCNFKNPLTLCSMVCSLMSIAGEALVIVVPKWHEYLNGWNPGNSVLHKKIKYVLDTAYIILNHTETKGETPVCKDIHFDITDVPSYILGFIPDEID